MPLVVTQQILPHLAPDVVVTAAGEDLVEEGGDLRDHPVAVDVELPVQLTERRLAGTLLVVVHDAGLAPEDERDEVSDSPPDNSYLLVTSCQSVFSPISLWTD